MAIRPLMAAVISTKVICGWARIPSYQLLVGNLNLYLSILCFKCTSRASSGATEK